METSVSLGIHALALSLSVHHATHRLTVILHWGGGFASPRDGRETRRGRCSTFDMLGRACGRGRSAWVRRRSPAPPKVHQGTSSTTGGKEVMDEGPPAALPPPLPRITHLYQSGGWGTKQRSRKGRGWGHANLTYSVCVAVLRGSG